MGEGPSAETEEGSISKPPSRGPDGGNPLELRGVPSCAVGQYTANRVETAEQTPEPAFARCQMLAGKIALMVSRITDEVVRRV